MMEPFFGAGTSMWTGLPPVPHFTYLPTPQGLTTATFGPSGAPGTSYGLPAAVHPLTMTDIPALIAVVATRRGQPYPPTTDHEIEDFLYDAIELLPGASDVEVRCEGGRVTLSGSVSHKRLKRDLGEVAWAIPVIHDVQNNVTIATRRRSRSLGRETRETRETTELQPSMAGGRKGA
jgi:BON domain-containing protein